MNAKEALHSSTIMLQMLGQKDSEAKTQESLIATLPPGPQKKREEEKLRAMLAAQLRLLEALRSALTNV
jgi:hypothetical protein